MCDATQPAWYSPTAVLFDAPVPTSLIWDGARCGCSSFFPTVLGFVVFIFHSAQAFDLFVLSADVVVVVVSFLRLITPYSWSWRLFFSSMGMWCVKVGMKVWRFEFTRVVPAICCRDRVVVLWWLLITGLLLWIDVKFCLWVRKDMIVVVYGRIGKVPLWWRRDGGRGSAMVVRLDPCWCGSACWHGISCWCSLGSWDGHVASLWSATCWVLLVFYYYCLLIVVRLMLSSSIRCWLDVLLVGGNTALGWWRVIANWTLPPSGRMRFMIAGVNFGRSYTGIVVGIHVLMRLSDRLRPDVVFPVDNRFFKAVDVGYALRHAIWCFFEYVDVLEAILIEMLSFIIKGFRFMSPPCILTTVLN